VVGVDRTEIGGWLHSWPSHLARARASFRVDQPRPVAAAHLVALLATALALAVDEGVEGRVEAELTSLLIFLGFAVLRVASVGRTLATSTLMLDAVGTALLLFGTGAPGSAYIFMAVAGAWWAANVPRRGGALLWAAAFAAAYGSLVLPVALRDRAVLGALEDLSVVVIVGLLADRLLRGSRHANELQAMRARVPAGAEHVAIREGLTRALGPMEISLDVLLAAAGAGLTVIQAELLAYLQMGLTNQEIADATKVGEPTVRYRLTALYRALGVRGRKAAVVRAMELALDFVAGGRPAVRPP
jgi:DNA-binding CsgD family transcriptional regulator